MSEGDHVISEGERALSLLETQEALITWDGHLRTFGITANVIRRMVEELKRRAVPTMRDGERPPIPSPQSLRVIAMWRDAISKFKEYGNAQLVSEVEMIIQAYDSEKLRADWAEEYAAWSRPMSTSMWQKRAETVESELRDCKAELAERSKADAKLARVIAASPCGTCQWSHEDGRFYNHNKVPPKWITWALRDDVS